MHFLKATASPSFIVSLCNPLPTYQGSGKFMDNFNEVDPIQYDDPERVSLKHRSLKLSIVYSLEVGFFWLSCGLWQVNDLHF